jgi:hypothetical protein
LLNDLLLSLLGIVTVIPPEGRTPERSKKAVAVKAAMMEASRDARPNWSGAETVPGA